MAYIKRYSPNQLKAAKMTTITAHSACEGTEPNSREHILAAIASGAEFVEIDVRCHNGLLYLSHDLPEEPTKCVSFDTFLKLVAPHPSLFVNCDVKTEGLLEQVIESAARYGMAHRILFTGQCNSDGEKISSLGGYLWHSLWRLKNADTEEGIKALNENQIREAVRYCLDTNCPYINLDKRIVNEDNIDFVQANGLNYSVWTVDDEDQMRMLLKKRVANITTRKPSLALRLRDEIQGTPEENGLLPDGTIEQIIKDASRIILGADYNRLKIKDKAGNANFVTEYDVKTQRFLMESFKALMPDCEFLAEEDDGDSNSVGDGYTFVIDPIDGTTNFMLDRRASCISVGLLKNKKPVYGAIFDPYTNRFFSAYVGKGAYCNHRPICVSDRTPSVGIASVGTAPYYRDTMATAVTKSFYNLLMSFGDLRRVGSAALSICEVACGESDAFCEPLLSPWDFTAGALLVTEAGGIISDYNGDPIGFEAPCGVLASTPTSYKTALEAIKNAD